jgi:VWFA-related protein
MNVRLMKSALSTMAITVTVLLALNMPLLGQKDQQPEANKPQNDIYKLSVKANLVLVPVIVVDKHGEHIGHLKPEDFELKEDGSVQKIARLDELTADSAKVEKASVGPQGFSNELVVDHPKKLEIIAIDQINTPFASSADSRRGLLNFLAKSNDSNTLLSLVVLSRNGIRVIHPFTSDPSVLNDAVRKTQSKLTARDTLTQNIPGDTAQADVESSMLLALLADTGVGNGSAGAQAAAARNSINQAYARNDASRQNQDALITLECFQQLSEYFAGVPGRKSLIWASSAFPFTLGSTPGEVSRGTTFADWERTFRMMQDANIAVYPVDVSGLVGSGTANNIQSLDSTAIKTQGGDGGVSARGGQLAAVENGSLVDPTIGRQQTMRSLADMTGGLPFYNSNDLSSLFRRAGEDCSQYYMLSFYSSGSGKNGWRKLSVKVHADGAKVRARAGYYYNPAGTNSDYTRKADEMMAMTSDLAFGSVPLRGEWREVEVAGEQRKVHFLISIPAGVPMIDSEHDRHISLDFRVVATDASGKPVGNIAQAFNTNLPPNDATTIQAKGFEYANELLLPPGQYKVHFVVRDNLRGTLGSMIAPLKVE